MNGFNRGGGFLGSLPQITKYILIINVLVFFGGFLVGNLSSSLPFRFALFNFSSEYFSPVQLVTHMFMHGSFMHLFFNMFAILIFGKVIETYWGGKKFFTLFVISGLGAAFLHLTISHFQMQSFYNAILEFNNAPDPDTFWAIAKDYSGFITDQGRQFAEDYYANPASSAYAQQASAMLEGIYRAILNIPMVGASGAVFGILAAFAMLFPNVELMLIFLPIPIKAKYFVPIYAVAELFLGVANFSGDNIAHFAHLGGAIVGFILVKIWKKNQFKVY